MALAQWFSLGHTALDIDNNRGNFAPAAAYMERLLSERVFAAEELSRVSDQILTTVRGAAMARPRQQGASGPERPRDGGAAPDRSGACYNWNRGVPCARTSCQFSHVCSECKGSHKSSACTAPRERAPIPKAPSSKGPRSVHTARSSKKDDGGAEE